MRAYRAQITIDRFGTWVLVLDVGSQSPTFSFFLWFTFDLGTQEPFIRHYFVRFSMHSTYGRLDHANLKKLRVPDPRFLKILKKFCDPRDFLEFLIVARGVSHPMKLHEFEMFNTEI